MSKHARIFRLVAWSITAASYAFGYGWKMGMAFVGGIGVWDLCTILGKRMWPLTEALGDEAQALITAINTHGLFGGSEKGLTIPKTSIAFSIEDYGPQGMWTRFNLSVDGLSLTITKSNEVEAISVAINAWFSRQAG